MDKDSYIKKLKRMFDNKYNLRVKDTVNKITRGIKNTGDVLITSFIFASYVVGASHLKLWKDEAKTQTQNIRTSEQVICPICCAQQELKLRVLSCEHCHRNACVTHSILRKVPHKCSVCYCYFDDFSMW